MSRWMKDPMGEKVGEGICDKKEARGEGQV